MAVNKKKREEEKEKKKRKDSPRVVGMSMQFEHCQTRTNCSNSVRTAHQCTVGCSNTVQTHGKGV